MSEPILTFLYNHSETDAAYGGTGEPLGDWKQIQLTTNSGSLADKKIYTGGGIHQALATPTATYGSREATIRPAIGTYPVPQIYIESEIDNIMYHVPLASGQPNSNRFVFGVYVDGLITSDLYLEMWDDFSFSTHTLPTLSGTSNYPYSVFNAIRTTDSAPPSGWGPTTSGVVNLAGYDNRLRLKGTDEIQNECLYYSMYAAIPWDLEFTHDTPVETYRYLYI
jgi:hypothetical protein